MLVTLLQHVLGGVRVALPRRACPPALHVVQSPLDGASRNVSVVRRHPQFAADIVEDSAGLQFTHPIPSESEIATLYARDYNAAYGRDLSPSAVIPRFVARRAAAQVAFLARWLPEPVSSVVEVGGGWGATSSALAAHGPPFPPRVTCFELDPAAVAYMNSSGVLGRHGTLETSDVVTDSVDLVVSSMMLEHLPDPRGALIAWRQKLRPGGYLFVEIPLENPVPRWWGTDPEKPYWVGHITFFGPGHLEMMLRAAGYEVIAIAGFDHPVAPGYVNEGDPPYDVDAVPEALDAVPSADPRPRLVRALARVRF